MRLAYYAGASTAAAAACLLKAFHERPNFYSATVYLSQSNACLLILTNLLLVLACTFIYVLQRLLYGPLRPVEVEQLSEKAWYAVLDTLLAMPSFREDVGGWLLTMFVLLLAGKVWGWIGEGRVDILEQQPPANPRLFHARLATSLIASVAFDLWMLSYCFETVSADPRPGMMVIFTFEFAVLSVFSLFTLCRYGLSVVEAGIQQRQMKQAIEDRRKEIQAERTVAARRSEAAGDGTSQANDEPIEVDENEVDVPGWEEKRRYLFALEVLTDFVKLMIYIVFFTVSITFNGLPMHIMRDVYMTFASFSKRVSDYVAYRKATSDMNTRYPDATTEEIRGDACIVCRESMLAWEQPNTHTPAQPAEQQQPQQQPAGQQQAPAPVPAAPAARRDEGLRAKKLPCGHILHLRCLKAWLERQQVCPTCRRPVITPQSVAAVPGQRGQPGAQPPAPGPDGQPRPPRPNRARIFNFGPVRIGFLNGPGDQINQVINQMRNGGQAGGIQGQAEDPNHQGPNHLGLQVPYISADDQQRAMAGAARATAPTQIQLMQLEQRMMQEAHNLGVEQHQLATLRMMEAELASLRSFRTPAQQPVGTGTPTSRQQNVQMPHVPIPGFMPTMPFQQAYNMPAAVMPPPQMLNGNPSQQLGNGSEGMPAGLTLPEGWTLMPLHLSQPNLAGVPHINVQPSGEQETVSSASVSAPDDPTAGGALTVNHEPPAPASETETSGGGPTDDNGSPLFVPAASPRPASTNDTHHPPAWNGTSLPTTSASSSTEESSRPQKESESKTPWPTGGEGWNFVGQNGGVASHGESQQHAAATPAEEQTYHANGAPAETTVGQQQQQQQQQTYTGKGKGKAVEVEDAPDGES